MKDMKIIIGLVILFSNLGVSQLTVCQSIKKSVNVTHGSFKLNNKLNSFEVYRPSNRTLHFNINCHKKLDRIQKTISQKISYDCKKSTITSVVTELALAFKHPTMTVSTDVLCALHDGISRKCPSNLYLPLLTHALDILVHAFHQDCIGKMRHIFQNDTQFWHNTAIKNIRYLDIFLGILFLVVFLIVNIFDFKKLTNRYKLPIIRHTFYCVSYTFNITTIFLAGFITLFVSSVSVPYTFKELLPAISIATSKHERTLAKKSKNIYAELIFNTNLNQSEFVYIESRLDDNEEPLSDIFPELLLVDEEKRNKLLTNHIKFNKLVHKVNISLIIFCNIIFIFSTWTYLIFFFKNI